MDRAGADDSVSQQAKSSLLSSTGSIQGIQAGALGGMSKAHPALETKYR